MWRAPCLYCRHLFRWGRQFRTCRAFPAGIPLEIWQGQCDHRRPFPGDHDIHFNALPSLQATSEPT